MRVCYGCGSEPGSGWSEEHVLPNALGGRWKMPGLLCGKCNSRFGHTIDVALCRELGTWMNMLSIPRERGDVPKHDVSIEGKGEFARSADGTLRLQRPHVSHERNGNEVNISVQARSTAELRGIIEGLSRKYPGKIDVDAFMANAQKTIDYVGDRTVFETGSAGSPQMFRAIAKIAVNAYLAWGGDPRAIDDISAYIRGDSERYLARWYFETDPVQGRNMESATHVVALRASASTRNAWAYVELFGPYRFAVRVSDDYGGPDIERSYAYDLCNESTAPVSVSFEPGDLDPEAPGLDADTVLAEGTRLVAIGEQRSHEQVLSNIVDAAFAKAFENFREPTMENLMPILIDRITPFYEAILRRGSKT